MLWRGMIPALLLGAAAFSDVLADPLEGAPTSAEILAASTAQDWRRIEPEETLYIDLERGRVVVDLSAGLAPGHVRQIKALARAKFYDGLSFYRVIDGFVAQAGLSDVRAPRDLGEAAERIPAEFDEPLSDGGEVAFLKDADGYADAVGFVNGAPVGVDEAAGRIWRLHCAGAAAMARDVARDTGGTEFYVTLQPQRYLDRNLSVFGQVVQGMEHLQALRRLSPPEKPDDDLGETIARIRVAADLPVAERTELEILREGTETFRAYVEARRNRSEAFFYHRPDHVDICQLPIPVREVGAENEADAQ